MIPLKPRGTPIGIMPQTNFPVPKLSGWVKHPEHHPNVTVANPDRIPLSIGTVKKKQVGQARNFLGMAIKFIYRRPKFTMKHLPHHITYVEEINCSGENDSVADYVVTFSNGAVVELKGEELNEHNRCNYQKRYKKNGRLLLKIITDTAKKFEKFVFDLIGQLAWHARSLFGVTLRRNGRICQNGEHQSKYRHMKRFQPNHGYA